MSATAIRTYTVYTRRRHHTENKALPRPSEARNSEKLEALRIRLNFIGNISEVERALAFQVHRGALLR